MPSNIPNRIVREAKRHAVTGVPTSTWYHMQARGEAPKPVPPNSRNGDRQGIPRTN